MTWATVSADGETITIHIPMTFRKRGGRKIIVTPDGAPWAPRPRVDSTLVKALARAFRWQRLLDDGIFRTIEELAKREKVNRAYLSRVLRLTLLAPDIVEAILDGREPEGMRLENILTRVRRHGSSSAISILNEARFRTVSRISKQGGRSGKRLIGSARSH